MSGSATLATSSTSTSGSTAATTSGDASTTSSASTSAQTSGDSEGADTADSSDAAVDSDESSTGTTAAASVTSEGAGSESESTTTSPSCPTDALIAHQAAGRLVVDARPTAEGWALDFEQGHAVSIASEAIAGLEDRPEQWRLELQCVSGEVLTLDRLGDELSIPSDALVLDPFGNAPLAASLDYTSPVPGRIFARVHGRRGATSDMTSPLGPQGTEHPTTILGLYPEFANTVEIFFTDEAGNVRRSESVVVETEPLPPGVPQVVVEVPHVDPVPHLGVLFEYLPLHQPFFADVHGDVRYIFTGAPGVKIAVQRLRNGNLAFGMWYEGVIHEYSWLGEPLASLEAEPEFTGFHHEVLELPSGNFAVATGRTGASTIEDLVIEIDRETGETLTVWDLGESLPTARQVLSDNLRDWIHINGLAYDEIHDALIVSSQRHGIVYLSRENELQWLLSPQVGWEETFLPYLLELEPGTDPPWGQHAPHLRANGHLLVFDNGPGRVPGTAENWSRIVEYALTPRPGGGGSARQVYEYGRTRPELFSPIVGDVDHFDETDSMLMVTGSLGYMYDYQGPSDSSLYWETGTVEKAKVILVDRNGNVSFEMTVRSEDGRQASLYRAETMILGDSGPTVGEPARLTVPFAPF